MSLKQKILPITTFVPMDVKRLFRDKTAIFFTFLFPLVFLVIFGLLSRGGNSTINVAVINRSVSQLGEDINQQIMSNPLFKVSKTATTRSLAEQQLQRGQIDAIINVPLGFARDKPGSSPLESQISVNYSPADPQVGSLVEAVLQDMLSNENIAAAKAVNSMTYFVVPAPTATNGASAFDYTFAGILGFTLLSLGVFGPANVFPRLKQKGVLRRYHTTTIKVWQYFTANVASNSVTALIAVAFMFVIGLTAFNLNMQGNYLNLAFIVVLGTILLFGIGLAVGGWAKNENQAAPVSQLITFPMMFLSGIFFPLYAFPEFLQTIGRFIPLTPIVDALRLIITENASLIDIAPQIGLMLGWIVIIYAIAFTVFKWE